MKNKNIKGYPFIKLPVYFKLLDFTCFHCRFFSYSWSITCVIQKQKKCNICIPNCFCLKTIIFFCTALHPTAICNPKYKITGLSCTTLSTSLQCSALCTVLYLTLLYCTILYSTLLYSTALYCTILGYCILFLLLPNSPLWEIPILLLNQVNFYKVLSTLHWEALMSWIDRRSMWN